MTGAQKERLRDTGEEVHVPQSRGFPSKSNGRHCHTLEERDRPFLWRTNREDSSTSISVPECQPWALWGKYDCFVLSYMFVVIFWRSVMLVFFKLFCVGGAFFLCLHVYVYIICMLGDLWWIPWHWTHRWLWSTVVSWELNLCMNKCS